MCLWVATVSLQLTLSFHFIGVKWSRVGFLSHKMLQVDKKSSENVLCSFLMLICSISDEEKLDELGRVDFDSVYTNMYQELLQ